MFQIKKILFPVDFSEPCLGASRYVEAFAGRFQAEITLLHVVDVTANRIMGAAAFWSVQGVDLAKEAREWGRRQMDTFLIDELKRP